MRTFKEKTMKKRIYRNDREPRRVVLLGQTWWMSKDRCYPEHQYGDAWRYENGLACNKPAMRK